MRDLKQIIAELSEKQVTRKQFLGIVAGSFLGTSGLFRYLQDMSTPPSRTDLANSDMGVFGERVYGYTMDSAHPTAKQIREDEFE